MNLILKLSANKTLLMINHRIENLQKFDIIYVMENG
jgi:ABC-type transport system involved in cytochrome bd biosynthesis fused ATPase/permease subunit